MALPRSFLQLDTDQHVIVCAQLELRSLLLLRRVSRAFCRAVGYMLRRTLELRCADYVPRPLSLLKTLTFIRGYVAGEVAVGWLMRSPRWPSLTLDVYVAAGLLRLVLDELTKNQAGIVVGVTEADEDDEEGHMERRAVEACATVYTSVGVVRVFESTIPDALATIACLHASVDMTYANFDYFGSAYAAMTLSRRGIVVDWEDGESELVEKWWKRGVDLRMSARAWPEYGQEWCAAARWSCHAQPRTFWDKGAMRCRMMPLDIREFRSTVIWRLDQRPCGGPCLSSTAGHGILAPEDKFAVM